MNKKTTAALVAGTMMMLLSSCALSKKAAATDDVATKMEDADMMDREFLTLSNDQRDLVKKNNDFALRLFSEVSDFDSKVVSPLSVSYLMGMLANGAEGTTRSEILKTLGWEGTSLNEVNAFCQMLMEKSGRLDPSTVVNTANYIALNKQYTLKKSFTETVGKAFKANVEALDFSSPKTATRINDWCSKQTDGMIPRMVDKLEDGDVACLLNAIYFNGTWEDKFDKAQTKQENFRGYTRDIKKVQMMHQNHKFDYLSNDTFSAVELPYGNGTYRMTVLLPNEGKTISDVLKAVSAESLSSLRDSMDECVVDLKLPRFTTELSLPLNNLVAKLGAPSMFLAGNADFSNMCDARVFVSKMLQKAKIEVAEEGTKAAAVSMGMISLTSVLHPQEPRHVEFHANRPFVYLITERTSGAIYFIGQFTGAE